MSVSGPLLIGLIVILSLCGATEYYVRPTEPTNTSCPAQPCLTLNQYINGSDHFFQSNTAFKFLPGTHHMDTPLQIRDVYNMSLESKNNEYPHIVTQFSCNRKAITNGILVYYDDSEVECVAVQFHNVHNVTFRGISLTVQAPNMSGITLKYVSNIHIQLNVTCSLLASYPEIDIRIGILMYEASVVKVCLSRTINCSGGLVIHKTSNLYIINTTAVYSKDTPETSLPIGGTGISLLSTTNAIIIGTSAMYNAGNGIFLEDTANVSVLNTTVMHNRYAGMGLASATCSTIININAVHNGNTGMNLWNSTRISIIDATAMHNGEGMVLANTASIGIINTTAVHNSYFGMILSDSNGISMINTTVMLNGYGGIRMYYTVDINITKSSLLRNGRMREVTTLSENFLGAVGFIGLPAVMELYHSSLHISECNVTRNNISTVKAIASNITASGVVIISNNRAIAGTAFLLVQNSILSLAKDGHIHFRNNHASNIGGVFYIADSAHYDRAIYNSRLYTLVANTCFFNTKGSRTQTRLIFSNNSAGEGGDILYGGHVMFSLDGDWNCLESFKNVTSISESGLSLITSDPSRVCLCNGTGQPDCLIVADPTPHSIYPGQSIIISAVVVGQVFGTVAGSVYAQFLQQESTDISPQLGPWQRIQSVTQERCNNLEYTIYSSDDMSEAVLILTVNNEKVPFLNNKGSTETSEWRWKDFEDIYHTSSLEPMKHSHDLVYVTVSLIPCPAGFMLISPPPFRCDCNQLLQQIHGVTCHIQDQTIGRSGLVWVGTLKDDNETVIVSEYCLLNYCDNEDSNITLSDPDSQCNYNHSGTLCGGCQPGLSLALGNAQCLPCSNKYLALLIPFALAGPALVFFIKLLDLTISQGTINGLIFYANVVNANGYMFLPQGQTNPLTLFIAWLNLDLGVETCFFHGLTAYTKTWLQFVFPLYIWSIAGLIIILAKYSHRVAKVMGNNSVPVLATLFLLSYAKLFRTIITALSYTTVYTAQGYKAVWTADGNVDYLGPKHAVLFVTAVAVLLFLWLPYTLVLFLGQWLYWCNCPLMNRMLIRIKPFLDAHYGPLKDKHRYWFGALLLARAIVLLISALVPANNASVVVICVSVCAGVLMFYGQMVYRQVSVLLFDSLFYLNLLFLAWTNLFTSTVAGDPAVMAYTLIGIAFFLFVGLVLFKASSSLKRRAKVVSCLHNKQDVEDDWELYEQAALLREMEANSDEQHSQDSASTESMESLPTY